jgi:hypothetical protein
MGSDYPILPPSPVSGVSSPWLPSSYSHTPVPVPDAIEPFPNPYTSMNLPTINSLSPPDSATTPRWDILSERERHSLATSTSSSPVPISAVPPVLLPISGSGSDELLQDAQLSNISPSHQKAYTDAYWKYFHPVFPFIHNRQRFMQPSSASGASGPRRLLAVTMMAIGAHYCDPVDSRILYDKCQEVMLKYKASITSTSKLEIMQAVVLAEFLAHFKAKRAPEGLTAIFRAVYDNVSQQR